MLPGNQGNPSTSVKPSQSSESTQNREGYNSIPQSNLDKCNKTADEILFQTLMNDPVKKAFLLKTLAEEKENITKYKQTEGVNLRKTPLKQCKSKRTYCESPTALLRRRALEKNCDSDSSSTRSFSPPNSTPVEFHKLLQGVVAYVEIRSKDTDRSAGAKILMESMGATIVDTLNRKVTHVIFKDGSFSTYQKAKLLKVHLVSVLWIEAIRKNNVRIPEKYYPALGTDTYDVDITALYQDYENIVQDERRRSLAVRSQSSGLETQKRNRLTFIPDDLSLSSRKFNKTSVNIIGRLSDVIPSSQEFDVESIMSFRSNGPNSVTLAGEKEAEIIEMTSDDDSDCGIINGHSFNHLKDSIISDLDLQLNQSAQKNNEQVNVNDETKSSTSSVSLLTRKSFTKTNNQLLDMDLTANVGGVPEKSIKDKSFAGEMTDETSKTKKSNKKNQNLQSIRKTLFSENNGSKTSELKNGDSFTQDSLSTIPLNQISTKRGTSSRKSSESPCIILSDVCLHPPHTSRNTKSSETVASSTTSNQNATHSSDVPRMSGLHEPHKTKSSETMPSLRISSEKTSNQNGIITVSSDSSNLDAPQVSEFRSSRKTKSSETMPSLRISTESTSNQNVIKPTVSSDRLNKQSLGTEPPMVSKFITRSTKSSETMPTLRISTESTSNQNGIKRTSDRLSKRSSNFSNTDPPIISNKRTRTTKSSESMPSLRISASSTSSHIGRRSLRSKSSESIPNLQTSIDEKHKAKGGVNYSNKLNKVGNNLSNTDETKSNEISGEDKKKINDSNNNKSQKLKPELGKNKRLRKLYNVNQGISNIKEFENVPEPQKNESFKRLVVYIPRMSVPESNVFEKQKQNVIVLPIKPKKKKFRKTTKKLNHIMESVGKLLTNAQTPEENSSNSIKDKTKQKINRKRLKNQKHESSEDSNDHSESPSKRRCSLRIQNLESQISSQLINRRSTLDFLPVSAVKSQKTLKLRTVKTSIVCTRMHKPEVQMFTQIVKKLGVYFVEDEVSKRTSHLVVGECKRTINLLRAICRGCWILKNEWLLRSLEAGKWLSEEDYELTDFSSAVQQCRRERQVFGNLYSMDIFSDCDPIYVVRNSTPRRSDLEELIELCKGTVAKEIYHAKIIVGDVIRHDKITCVTEKWILDSITHNKKESFRKYLIQPTA